MKALICFLLFLNAFSVSESKGMSVISRDTTNQKTISRNVMYHYQKSDYDSISTYFHASLKPSLPVEKIAEGWETMNEQYGRFEKILSVKTLKDDDYSVILLRCKFQKDNATVQLAFNQDDKLVGLYFKP